MNPLVKSNAIKFGLIASSVSILYYLIAYLFNEQLFVNMYIGIFFWIFFVIVFILAVQAVKKRQEGYILFKDAFSAFSLGWIISAAISTVFSLLLFQVVDSDLAVRIQEMAMESMYEVYTGMGMSEEQIDEAMNSVEGRFENQYKLSGLLMGFAFNIVFGAILGLIVAAFMKKTPPVFETLDD